LTAALSLAAGVALVGYPPLRSDRLWQVVVAVGGLGLLALVVALAGRLTGLLPWAIALVAGEYATALLLRGGTIDGAAPLYGAGLLVLAELAYWSLELPLAAEPGIATRRAARLALLALVGGGVAALVLAASELATEGGLVLEAFGVAAAAGALALVALLARRPA
jgi:hypothetical protein